MAYYWTPAQDKAIKDYYYSTSTAERNRIIDKELQCTLYEIARRALSAFGLKPDPEKEQDIVVYLVCRTLPKLDESRLQGALQFLWSSARNYILTYILRKPKTRPDIVEITQDPGRYTYSSTTTSPVDLDAEYEKLKLRKKVLDEIDLKLKGQQVINATNSVFLLLLRQYLIDNDFEVRGFGEYVRNAMHLKLSTYRAISGRLGLRTKDFNEKLTKG